MFFSSISFSFVVKKDNFFCKKKNIYIKEKIFIDKNYLSFKNNKKKNIILKNKKIFSFLKKNNKDKVIFDKKRYRLCKFNIAIDPGHGGQDPGAIGFYGSKEKDITLTISKKLLNIINSYGKFNAFLIRNDDRYISLKKRLIIARNKNANLFLSIHVNSIKDRYIEGASVWILSTLNKYKLENNWNKISFLNFNNKFYLNYWIDKFKKKKYKMNFYLASEIINKFNKVIFLHSSIPQYGDLTVLTLFNVPSVLIETGYISNPSEEKKLINNIYQKIMAKYIYLGVSNFIKKICIINNIN